MIYGVGSIFLLSLSNVFHIPLIYEERFVNYRNHTKMTDFYAQWSAAVEQ